MSTTAQRLIIDTERATLIGSFSTVTGTTNPTFVLGDTCPIEIYLVKQSGTNSPLSNIDFPAGALVKCAIGLINLQPSSGTWSIGYNGELADDLPYNIGAEDLEVAINSLATVTSAGGVTVDLVGNQFRVAWNTTGDKLSFYPGTNTLVPASDLQVQTLQQGGVSTKEVVMVNLAARPIALQTTFTDKPPVTGYRSTNTFGFTGTPTGGSYRLCLSFTQETAKTVWTDAILFSSNTTQISQAIFQALVNAGWGFIQGNATTNGWGVLVTQLVGNNYRVDITNPQFTTPVTQVIPTLQQIDIAEISSLSGKVGELALNTVEAVAFLGTDENRRAILEIEVDAGGEVQTLLQAPCTLVGQVIYGGTFAPIQLDVPMSEAIADTRYLRRDADQALDDSTKNQLWENLTGVTTPTGVDLIGSLTGAASPSATNPLATMADVQSFDQPLNTTDAPTFTGLDLGAGLVEAGSASISGALETGSAVVQGETKTVSFKIGDATNEYLAIDAAGVISTSSNAFLGSVTITGSGTDTVYAFDSVGFQGTTVLSPSSLNLNDSGAYASVSPSLGLLVNNGIQSIQVDATAGITFPDLTTQTSAPVSSPGTGQSGGSGPTIHGDNYPDEVTIVIAGVTYAMPARII